MNLYECFSCHSVLDRYMLIRYELPDGTVSGRCPICFGLVKSR